MTYWKHYDTVKLVNGYIVRSREQLIYLCYRFGVDVNPDAKIFVGIGDCELTYAIEDVNGDYVFMQDDNLVTPDHVEAIVRQLEFIKI